MGQHQKADADFTSAIALRTSAVRPYLARGQSRYVLGKYQEAAKDFGVAAEQLKEDPDAWTWRGMALEKTGDADQAANAYRWAIYYKPGHGPAVDGLRRLGQSPRSR